MGPQFCPLFAAQAEATRPLIVIPLSALQHAGTSTLALHLLQSALVHVKTMLLQQVLAELAWPKKLNDEGQRGLTALF
ncbi:hypothetical protein AB0442_23175 [Kitasatospora sp. NPDC085895]|uniref:hypothetical protein n=1 Tax=Kitasatospora sp. NPDC085895 TaxID=3155057 RepID=UPI003450CAA3